MICPKCGNDVEWSTDSNYNSAHTKLYCEECDTWISLTETSTFFDENSTEESAKTFKVND